jgi:hypothetical protein
MALLQLVPQGGINALISVVGQGFSLAKLNCNPKGLPYIFEDKIFMQQFHL